jgi:hypothetical protein
MKPVDLWLHEDEWQVGGAAAARFPLDAPVGVPAALLEHLRVHAPGASVRVCVGTSWVRLFVLPFSARLDAEARWAPFAQARFEQLFGESADGWSLGWLREPPPHPRLAAALPSPLLDALRRAFGRRLAGVRADALTRLQALRLRQPRFTGAVLDVGPRHTLLTLLRDGRPHRTRLRRGAADSALLGALLKSEWAAFAAQSDGLPAEPPRVLRLD